MVSEVRNTTEGFGTLCISFYHPFIRRLKISLIRVESNAPVLLSIRLLMGYLTLLTSQGLSGFMPYPKLALSISRSGKIDEKALEGLG